jgi:SAM-dependent methyltransferase
VSNNDVLTAKEFDAFSPNVIAMSRLEECRRRLGREKGKFRILDWGCGRGATVLWLRERGYDAFGADIDAAPRENARELFRTKGYGIDDCIRLIDPVGTTPFAGASFHFVLSNQVLEHVASLETVAQEIRRLTAPEGEGFHVFPPHRRIVEPHLFMPFVHWLPKNGVRKFAIGIWVLIGVEPRWWSPGEVTFREKVRTYHAFSVGDTFYRSPVAVRSAFVEQGFSAEYVDVSTAGIRHWLSQTIPSFAPTSPSMRFWATNFASDVGLATRLPG